jgi:hypothetical protein
MRFGNKHLQSRRRTCHFIFCDESPTGIALRPKLSPDRIRWGKRPMHVLRLPRRRWRWCFLSKDNQKILSREPFWFSLYLHLGGGRESSDNAILEDLGLIYSSFKCEATADKRKHFEWRNDRWKPTKSFNPLATIFEFLSKRSELAADIALEIGSRWNGGIIQDDSVGEHKLRDLADLKEGRRRKLYWRGEIERCDLCGHDFENDQYMVDAITTHGLGANMCAGCFEKQKAEIGWGTGQLYQKERRRWLLVGGFPPS